MHSVYRELILQINLFSMRKQKLAPAKICYCEEYRFEEKQLKLLIIEKLKCTSQCQNWSNQKLLKVYFDYVEEKNKFIQSIDQTLRNFIKQEPTIHYNVCDTIPVMIDSLISKIKKQRDVHQHVLKQERLIIQQHLVRQQKLIDQIEYLKQLLKEEQREVQTWRAEAIQYEKQSLNYKKKFQYSHYENQQMKLTLEQKKDTILKCQKKLQILQNDNSMLSRKILQKTSQMTRLKEEIQSEVNLARYEAKIEAQKQLQVFKNQLILNKNHSKQLDDQQIQKPEPSKISNKIEASPYNGQRSMSSDKNHSKIMNLDSTLSLNRSLSIKNQKPQNIWMQKNNSLQLSKQQIFNNLFVGDVLYGQNEMRTYLVQLLQKCQKNVIIRTKLLYRLDYLNNVNIHRYVDGRHNVVFLFKTDNDQFIAAYSRGAFRSKSISNHLGLLISLNNKIEFKNTKRAIVYDQNQIIFGNFDLRYKSGDNKITSNFGMTGTFYQSKGQSVSILLGEGKNRDVKIRYMQVFQAIFQS